MTIDLTKIRSFWRFTTLIALSSLLGVVLFHTRFILLYDAPLPDLISDEGRAELADETVFIFWLFIVPMTLFCWLLGYPFWRLGIRSLTARGMPGWISLAGGSLALALVAQIPFVLLFTLAGSSGDIVGSIDLLVFLAGIVFSASFLLGSLLYRSRQDGRLANDAEQTGHSTQSY